MDRLTARMKPTEKHRPRNSTQRFKPGMELHPTSVFRLRSEKRHMLICAIGPALVHKLGHFGMCVTDFTRAYEFYTTRFNFKPSDVSAQSKNN